MTRPDGERIAVLETHIELLLKQQEQMQTDLSEVKEILQQARGAKWVVLVGAAVSGSIITYLPWLAKILGLIQSG